MGQTIVEMILAAYKDRHVVRPGEFVAAGVDLVLANDAGGLVPHVRGRLAGERGPALR